MKRFFSAIVGTALMLTACSQSPANETVANRSTTFIEVPAIKLAGRVTDAAGILTPSQGERLTTQLSELERRTLHQMVVVTVPTLEGRDISSYATELGNAWGIGRKDYDDGVIVLVAPNERQVRIAVGYGLEKTLPNDVCKAIIDERMLPRFRNGDMGGAIEAGVDALIAELT